MLYNQYGNHREYEPLVALLPLDTPLSLQIDPTNACNFKCHFCPTGDPDLLRQAGRQVRTMPLGMFEKVLEQIEEFPRPVRVVHLYKDGEPLANQNLVTFVRMLKTSRHVEAVEMTSNLFLLTPDRATKLVHAGLDAIRVSCYGTTPLEYEQATGKLGAGPAQLMARLSELKRAKGDGDKPHVHVKIINTGLTDEQTQRFVDLYESYADTLEISAPLTWGDSGTGLPVVQPPPYWKPDRKVCSEPFTRLVVNSNGDIGVCCMDWRHDLCLGHVDSTTLRQAWESDGLAELRKQHLRGNRDAYPICSDCGYVQTLRPEADLDGVAVELLEKY